MNYNEVLENARGCIGPYCKACPVCNGKACGNAMPGPGCKYPGNTASRNFEKWQEVCVNMDTLCPNADPDVSFELFGKTFSAPIFAAPLGALPMHYGDKHTDQTYNRIMLKAAAEYGVAGFTGDGVDPEIMKDAVKDMLPLGGIGIPTIKPWNKEAVFDKLDILNANNIFAAAMDVDGAGLPFLKAMNPNAGSKTVEEMKEITGYAKMPFIIKGIMTVAGAKKAVEAKRIFPIAFCSAKTANCGLLFTSFNSSLSLFSSITLIPLSVWQIRQLLQAGRNISLPGSPY